MNLIKRILKPWVFMAVDFFGRHRRHYFSQPQLLILTYHRILPLDHPATALEQPGMYVSPETFEQHLLWLQELGFELIKLGDWVNRCQTNQPLPNKACALTFDDGWADNYQYAFPLLQKHNAPATIFVIGSSFKGEDTLWPAKLATLLKYTAEHTPQYWSNSAFNWLTKLEVDYNFGPTMLTQQQLDQLITQVKQYSDKEIHQAIYNCKALIKMPLGTNTHFLTQQQTTDMLASDLIELGSHTMNHCRLSNSMTTTELKEELVDSKHYLINKFNTVIDLFCFPDGDVLDKAMPTIEQHYNAAVTTESGWNTADDNQWRLKRIHLHQDMSDQKHKFGAKISGLL